MDQTNRRERKNPAASNETAGYIVIARQTSLCRSFRWREPSALDAVVDSGMGISEEKMPELHQRGVELLVDVLDATEHADQMRPAEIKGLLTQIGVVLGQLLERDVPAERRETIIAESRK